MKQAQIMPNFYSNCKIFKRNSITLIKQSRDDRINSAFNEDEIFKLLESNSTISQICVIGLILKKMGYFVL